MSIIGVLDYIIIVATIVISIGIGIYFRFTGGKQKTNVEYLLGDRNMPAWVVSISLMTSFMSGVSLLGNINEVYSFGAHNIIISIGHLLAVPAGTHFFLPVFFNLQKLSTYEYLELRFGRRIRMAASLTYTLQTVLYTAIVMFAPSIVLEAVSGLDRVMSTVIVGVACTIYSVIGGMKAILITDVLQTFLMFVSVIIVAVFATIEVGGFGEVFKLANEGGRLYVTNFSLDPVERHTWWSLIVGGFFLHLSVYGINHTQIQRLLTVPDLKNAKCSIWLSYPMLVAISVLSIFSGVAIYAVYRSCDPFIAGNITARDQLMAYYVIDAMGNIPGLVGIFIAGILSASLSTISSSCNSLAAVTITDFIKPWYAPKPSLETIITKIVAAAFGLVFLGLAFIVEYMGPIMQAAATILGVVGGCLLGIFTLGMFTTYATENGSLIGLICGLTYAFWVNFGGPRPAAPLLPFNVEGCPGNVTLPDTPSSNPEDFFYLYRVSYLWNSVSAFLWVIVIGSLVSLIWKTKQPWQKEGNDGYPDPNLFTPLLAKHLQKNKIKNGEKNKSVDLKTTLQVECFKYIDP